MAELGPINSQDPVIWNGVEARDLTLPRIRSDRFCKAFGWPSNSIIVGMTGQMTPTKGHEDFIEAAVRVTRVNPKAKFVIGGKPLEPFHTMLRKRISGENLQGIVEFSGWIDNVVDFFDGIDLFVLPSRHDEGFGLVLAEAGERGLASVATRSGGATEIIVHDETGILVEKVQPAAMASAIEKLLVDIDLRREMGGRARARVVEFFNLDRQAEKIKAFLAAI